jgi:DNA topoisomerase-1
MYTLVVESPAKAKTINKYLGKDFKVLASFGHVRDLPSKDGSVRPDENFAMDYEVDSGSKKHLNAIADSLKDSTILYMATDPDREGEAISWHVVEALRESKKLKKNVEVKRVTFTEITKKAVLHAVANPREIDMDLVNAQQARRALDYLVGFSLSPILWRKLPGAKSAGRVQSVALRLICERDAEIERFISQEYWDISAEFLSNEGALVNARLSHWQGEKLEKLSINNALRANEIADALRGGKVKVDEVKPKQMRRNPYPPFTTSTLQMDASRRLGFSAKQTMMIAQKLYEGIAINGEAVGLITYMRTDGVQVSTDAISEARGFIQGDFGEKYLPSSPRIYASKAKNAQEAHEAIRPTSIKRTPYSIKSALSDEQYKLYELIWKRMVASQMEAAIYDQVSITFNAEGKNAAFRASGSVLRFDGFLKLYRQAMDDDQSDEAENQALPPLKSGEMLAINQITPAQHFTEAPPRFTEASLVKRLEELGIGRPSTYAAIISVLQERGYVRLDKKRFIAEMRGRLVSSFLEAYFTKYVEYDFTAQLENQLDEVSDGKQEWTEVLRNFWQPFIALINETKELTPREILEKIDGLLAQFIYNKLDVTDADKACPSCKVGKLHLKTGKFGAFLGCDQYPTCNYKKALDVSGDADDPSHGDVEFPRTLGMHPSLSVEIQMKKGPYGVYVEMEEDGKAKRASLPKGRDAASFTLEEAVKLLALPRLVGNHPEDGKPIKAGLGRFGAYLQYDGKYISLKGDDDVLTIGMNRAVDLIAIAATKVGKATAAPLRILGKHPNDDVELAIYDGKYGAYIKYHKINASLPKGADIASFTLEDAVKLIASKDDGKAKTTSASSKKTSSKSVVAEKTVKLKKTTTSNKSKATASKKTM